MNASRGIVEDFPDIDHDKRHVPWVKE